MLGVGVEIEIQERSDTADGSVDWVTHYREKSGIT